jgi:Viral BACON domain
MRRFSTLGLGLLFALVAQPLLASTIKYVTDRELIELSDRVVHARVVGQRAEWGGPNLDRIYTVTTLEILEDLTGRTGDRVEVWELGGTIGDSALYVGGQVRYRAGEEVLVCLRQGRQGLHSVAMGFSKFDVRRTAAGASLVRNAGDVLVVGAPARISDPTLDEFRRLAELVTGRPSRLVQRPANPDQVQSVRSEFVLLGNFRWAEADTSTPISWRRNLTASSPLTSGNVDTEIGVALAAWTNPPSASLIFQAAGTTTFNSDPEAGGYTGGLITFEDPNGDIDPPVLAFGGGGCSGCTTSTANGTTFTNFTFGFVIFDNAATLDPSFRTPPNFTRVMTHEAGHALGLGHSDLSSPPIANPEANIMNSSCCFPQTPTPPNIGPDDIAGLNFIYPVMGSGPQMALDKTSLRFGAVTSGSSFLSQTATQVVRMTQSGAGTVTWTATSNQSWLQVSPASGSGSATFSISVVAVAGLPPNGTVNGSITLVFTGAGNSPGPISVALTLIPNGTSTLAVGVVDTPSDNRTGVTGAIPFTGWALDDVEVLRVMICRAAFGAESAPVDPNCAGAPQIFVGFAIFIDGARPDVQAGFPNHPVNSRAGWGFMVLTNMLPNQGNGTYQFFVYAQDRDGHTTLLGTRTMTCSNATATVPFGAIDTPTQGGLASGASFVNFAWALTQAGKIIPVDGSTISVLIDGVSIGTVSYNHFRSDIATLFPGLANSNGAIGFKIINTTTMTNGLHTIVWVVADNTGAFEGIGSRFFTVSNGVGGLTAAATAERATSVPRPAAIAAVPVDETLVIGRRGFDLEGPWRQYGVGRAGRAVIRGEELDRFELALGAQAGERYSGHLRVGAELAAMPAGSRLDAATGAFTWAPGVGFVGAYDLVFVRWAGGRAVARREVRIILAPKGRGHVGTQVEIDTPRSQANVTQPVVLTGWTADLDAAGGTGIDTVHVWALPRHGGAPILVGTADLGGVRPDVAAVHGEQFRSSGFALTIGGLTPGVYDLAVFPWSNVTGGFAPPKTVSLHVR